MELSEEQKKELIEFQSLQQQMQLIMLQRQQVVLQISELEKAREETEKSSGILFRFVGGILVPKQKDALAKELKEEKESLEVRGSVLQRQEEKIRERLEEFRKKFQAIQSSSGETQVKKAKKAQ